MKSYKYNEKEYAESILKNGFGTKYIKNELKVLAKYYKHQGNTPKEREKLLYDFCEKNLENYSKVKYYKVINSALNYARKKENQLIEIESIAISNNELNYINNENVSVTQKKILFTLLVLDKLSRKIKEIRGLDNVNEYYFGGNNARYKELVSSSNVNFGSKYEFRDIHSLIGDLDKLGIIEIRSQGYIKLSYMYDLTQGEDVEIEIKDFDNIGLYYDLHIGTNKVKKCECCEVPIKVLSNKKIYCAKCSVEIDREKAKERMRNKRMFDIPRS